MRIHPSSLATAVRRTRRPLVLVLGAALLFELSLLGGVLASPFFREWMPRRAAPVDDGTAMLIHWRRSVYQPERDPRLGEPGPRLSLGGAPGPKLSLAALHGKKVVLLFLRDGNT